MTHYFKEIISLMKEKAQINTKRQWIHNTVKVSHDTGHYSPNNVFVSLGIYKDSSEILFCSHSSLLIKNHGSGSEVTQLCPTLCDPMDCSLQGSSVHGIFQARVLEWVAISFSRESSRLRDRTWVSHIAGRCFTVWANYTVHGILQARILEWVAISFSRESSRPRDRT